MADLPSLTRNQPSRFRPAGVWQFSSFRGGKLASLSPLTGRDRPRSVLAGIHPVADDGGFAQRLGGFQPVQALD